MDRCKIVGAFDTETSNVGDIITGFEAFPILYQYGRVTSDVEELTPDNTRELVEVTTARKENEIYKCFDAAIETANGYIPVILVHNLGFDMYALAPYLNSHSTRVLAKTAKKPISFAIQDEQQKPVLIFLDTLGLFMKSLKVLGDECGMPKAVGDWDYMLVRTPDTPLTDEEMNYAKQDIYTLLVYMSYFLKQNPDIKQADIGTRVQTKTGIVRAKRLVHVGGLKPRNGKTKVRQFWHLLNKSQRPKSNDELFTMHAATRGGFTFCAKHNASRIFLADDTHSIESYDSTSQHPAQMVSHLYPQDFKEATPGQLKAAFDLCAHTSMDRVLKSWVKPFPFAFNGAFRFENLRSKPDTVFDREGIYPLASARITQAAPLFDNQANTEFKDAAKALGYGDSATGAGYSFGKLESAESCVLYLTELEAWIISRCYVWDNVAALHGYLTSKFRKAPDMATLSVMRYYSAKDALKNFMTLYTPGKKNDVSKIAKYYPAPFVERCKVGDAIEGELKEYYMLSKADLNSLFGIEATNECRRDYELHDTNGLELVGQDGIENLPRQSKAFYQFGQRIVGWSRVAQVCIMELIAPYVTNIICGDTDSLKIYYPKENAAKLNAALAKHAKALDRGKRAACARIKAAYKTHYNSLDGIGHYVFDGAYNGFSASWNKSYIALKNGHCRLTIAGVPTSRRSNECGSFNDFCDSLISEGLTFEEVASLVIGYNVTIDDTITKLNARVHPKGFGIYLDRTVTDYLGNTVRVHAPSALALYPNVKTLGDTSSPDNASNLKIAQENNPLVNSKPVWLKWTDGKAIVER